MKKCENTRMTAVERMWSSLREKARNLLSYHSSSKEGDCFKTEKVIIVTPAEKEAVTLYIRATVTSVKTAKPSKIFTIPGKKWVPQVKALLAIPVKRRDVTLTKGVKNGKNVKKWHSDEGEDADKEDGDDEDNDDEQEEEIEPQLIVDESFYSTWFLSYPVTKKLTENYTNYKLFGLLF